MLDAADVDANDWWSTFDVAWALQRPDFHLYGTAADAAGAGDLLDHLRDRLGRRILTPEGTAP